MTLRTHRRRSGFSLIEILVSIVVLAIALAALAKFQGGLMRGGTEARARSVAVGLAKEKLADLSSFSDLSGSDAGTFYYSDIDDDAGGLEKTGGGLQYPSGEVDTSRVPNASAVYTLAWTSADSVDIVGDQPAFKDVVVTVSWVDQQGNNQAVSLAQTISASSPASSARAARFPPEQEGPVVLYAPGALPDYVPIDIDITAGKKKETSKPVPTVLRADESTLVSFDEVTYDSVNNTQQREQFLTVSCVCIQGEATDVDGDGLSLGEGYTPGIRSLGVDVTGAAVTKRVGHADSLGGNPIGGVYCEVCCRDHHDTDATDANGDAYPEYDSFRPGTTSIDTDDDGVTDSNQLLWRAGDGDHVHFNLDNSGLWVTADNVGDEYLEACRLKRINGNLVTMTDWNLVAMQAMPADYFSQTIGSSTGVHFYTQYVTDLVTNYVTDIDGSYPGYQPIAYGVFDNEPTSFSLPLNAGVNSIEDMAFRGIYIDYMDADTVSAAQAAISAGENFLDIVPFYEVNLTKLANWSSSTSAASVTNEPITATTEATYSRGVVEAEADGTADVTAVIEMSNTGLTDSKAIDPPDGDEPKTLNVVENSLDDQNTVTVGGVVTPPAGGYLVSGAITLAGGTESPTSLNPSNVTVTIAGGGISCNKPSDSSFECQMDGSGNGQIVFGGYKQLKPPSDWNNYVCVNTSPVPAELTAGPVETGTELVAVNTFTFSGVASTGLTLDIIVQKTSSCP